MSAHLGPVPALRATPGFGTGASLSDPTPPAHVGRDARGRICLGGLLLMLADCMVLSALTIAAIALADAADIPVPAGQQGLLVAAIVGSTLVLGYCLRIYDPAGSGPIERFRLRILSGLLAPAIALVPLALRAPVAASDLAVVALISAAAIPLLLMSEGLVRQVLIRRNKWGRPAVLVGEPEQVAVAVARLRAHPELGLRPVGVVGHRPGKSAIDVLPHLGSLEQAGKLAGRFDVAVIVSRGADTALSLSQLPFRRVIVLSEAAGMPSLGVRTRDMGGMLGLEFACASSRSWGHIARRGLELIVALPLLIVTAPLVVLAGAAVWAVDPGPVIYRQRRVGLRGRPVSIFKLRSMYLDAEERLHKLLAEDEAAREQWNRFMKLPRDPRVLPWIGNFIRRTSMDEVPQFWNVVRGDISLVGPRPFPSYHTERFAPDFQALRASVRPGLTGLWQVSDRSDADLAQQAQIDAFYIRNRSFWLDLYILARTLPAALTAKGAR